MSRAHFARPTIMIRRKSINAKLVTSTNDRGNSNSVITTNAAMPSLPNAPEQSGTNPQIQDRPCPAAHQSLYRVHEAQATSTLSWCLTNCDEGTKDKQLSGPGRMRTRPHSIGEGFNWLSCYKYVSLAQVLYTAAAALELRLTQRAATGFFFCIPASGLGTGRGCPPACLCVAWSWLYETLNLILGSCSIIPKFGMFSAPSFFAFRPSRLKTQKACHDFHKFGTGHTMQDVSYALALMGLQLRMDVAFRLVRTPDTQVREALADQQKAPRRTERKTLNPIYTPNRP